MGLEKDDILALIAILQKGLTNDTDQLQYREETPERKALKQKIASKPNKFDKMTEKNLHKSDTKIDKLLWGDNQPTDRRQESGMVEARCRVCGKTEQVNGALAEVGERYKCNKCATTSG